MRNVSVYATKFKSDTLYTFACGACLMTSHYGQQIRIGETIIHIDRKAATKLLKNEKIVAISRTVKTAGAGVMDFLYNKKVG